MFVLVAGNTDSFIASFADRDTAERVATFLEYDVYQILEGEAYHQPRPALKTLFEVLSPLRIQQLAEEAENVIVDSRLRRADRIAIENIIRKSLMEASIHLNK